MRRSAIRFGLALVLAATAMPHAATDEGRALAPAAFRATDLIPEGAVLVAHLPDTARTRERWAGSPFGALAAEPEVETFRTWLAGWLPERIRETAAPDGRAGAESAKRIQDLLALAEFPALVVGGIDGEAVFAVTELACPPQQLPSMRAVAVIRIAGSEQRFAAWVNRMAGILGRPDHVRHTTGRHRGVDYSMIGEDPDPNAETVRFAWAIHDGWFLWASDEAGLQRTLDRALDATERLAGTARSAEYAAVTGEIGGDENDLLIYVDTDEALQTLRPILQVAARRSRDRPAYLPLRALVEESLAPVIEGVGYGLTVGEAGLIERTYLHAPSGGAPGLVGIARNPLPESSHLTQMVPPDAVMLMRMRVNGSEMLQNAKDLMIARLERTNPDLDGKEIRKRIDDAFAYVDQLLFSIDDLLGSLGDELITYAGAPAIRPDGGARFPVGIALGLRNRTQMELAIGKLPALCEQFQIARSGIFAEEEYRGETILVVDLDPATTQQWVVQSPEFQQVTAFLTDRIAFCVTERALLVANDARVMYGMIDRIASRSGASLTDSDAYRTAMGASPHSRRAPLTIYLDGTRITESALEGFRILAAGKGGGIEALARQLPPWESIEPHTGPVALLAAPTGSGVLLESRTPFFLPLPQPGMSPWGLGFARGLR